MLAVFSLLNTVGGASGQVIFLGLSVHALFVIPLLLVRYPGYGLLFAGAFLLRAGFMLWDIYARHLFKFPNSGADTEMFYRMAVAISQNIEWLFTDLRGGFYSKINGLIFHFVGPERLVGHYMNVLAGVSVVAVVYAILNRLEIKGKTATTVLLITAFFPNSLVMSAVFLREIFPTLFVAISLYYFVVWFQENRMKDLALSVAMLGVASVFHSGVVGLLLGYSFAFLFYQARSGLFRFTGQSIAAFIVLSICLTLAATQYQEVFFGKFQNVEEFEDIYDTANSRRGQSAYLEGVAIDSPASLTLWGPVKILYFMAAPVPWDWRGFADVLTFFLDSLLYIGAFVYLLLSRKYFTNRQALYICLFLALLGAIIIFGIGVSNAGTAMRHRQKLIPLFLILLALAMDSRWRFKSRRKELSQRL
jgi:hypothetical protein